MPRLKNYLELHFVIFLWGFTAILGKLISIPAVELVALGIRQREGFDLVQLSRIGDFDARAVLNASLTSFVSQGMMSEHNGRIAPTARALALADGMAARLVSQF